MNPIILTIARAELRLHWRRPGTWLLLALFAVLVASAAGLNHARQARDRARQHDYQHLVRAQWEAQPDRHPHRVAHYGTFAFKPPGPLAAFEPGVESYGGRIQYLEAHRQNAANFAEAGAMASVFRLGELSPAWVLQALLPLVVVVLGHRAMADEAESGRLRLIVAQGGAIRALVLGKLAGLALAVLPFALVGGAGAAVGIVADPAFRADPEAGARAATIVGALALHTVAWLGLTLWVSTRARSAARACAVLVAVWAGACVVAPRLAAVAATTLHPLPDKSGFAAAVAAEVRSLGDAHDPDDPNFARLRSETLARHGVTRVEDLPFNYRGVVMAHGEQLTAETFARHFETLGRTMSAQVAVVDRSAVVAPFLALRALCTAAAGTDLGAWLHFQREAEAYRYRFVQRLNTLHRDEVRYTGDGDQRISARHWHAFDDFAARPPALVQALEGRVAAWWILAGWALLPLVALIRVEARLS